MLKANGTSGQASSGGGPGFRMRLLYPVKSIGAVAKWSS